MILLERIYYPHIGQTNIRKKYRMNFFFILTNDFIYLDVYVGMVKIYYVYQNKIIMYKSRINFLLKKCFIDKKHRTDILSVLNLNRRAFVSKTIKQDQK